MDFCVAMVSLFHILIPISLLTRLFKGSIYKLWLKLFEVANVFTPPLSFQFCFGTDSEVLASHKTVVWLKSNRIG